MPEEYQPQFSSDLNMKLQDLEERQRLLRERVVLVGNSLIEEREKTFDEMQELKKIVLKLKEDNIRMKEFLQNLSESFRGFARKEEVMILQRQFDMLKPHVKSE